MLRLPFLPSYVLAADLAEGRPVVDLLPAPGASSRELGLLGPRAVAILSPGEVRASDGTGVVEVRAAPEATPLPDGFAGAVLCLGLGGLDADRWGAVLREARRLAGTDGVLVTIVDAGSDPTLLSMAPGPSAPIDAAELQRAIRPQFPHIALVGQSPLIAYSLKRLAFQDAEAPLTLHASFAEGGAAETSLVAVCGARYRRLDSSHLVELPYRRFDEEVRARIDELGDLYHTARTEAARSREGLAQAQSEIAALEPRAALAAQASSAATELGQRVAALEAELAQLRGAHEVQGSALSTSEVERKDALARAADAESRAAIATAAVDKLSQLRDDAIAERSTLSREALELRERVQELRRALDERDEDLALARSERDAASSAKAELARRAQELDRGLGQARSARETAEARERTAAAAMEAARQRFELLERELQDAETRERNVAERLGRTEDELRRAEARGVQARDDAWSEQARLEAELRSANDERARELARREQAMALVQAELEAARIAAREQAHGVEERASQISRLEEDRALLQRQLREAGRERDELLVRLEAAEQTSTTLRSDLDRSRQGSAEHAVKEREHDETRAALTRTERERAEARAEVERLSAELARLKATLDKATHEAEETRRERGQQALEIQRLTADTSRAEGLETALKASREVIQTLSDRSTQLEGELERACREIADLRQNVSALEDERIKARATSQRAAEQAAELEGQVEDARKDAERRGGEAQAARREIDQHRDKAAEAERSAARLKNQLGETQLEVERVRQEAMEAMQDGERLRKEMAGARLAAAEAQSESARLRKEAGRDALAEVARLKAELAEVREELTELTSEREGLESQVTHLNAELEISRVDARRNTDRIAELTTELDRLRPPRVAR